MVHACQKLELRWQAWHVHWCIVSAYSWKWCWVAGDLPMIYTKSQTFYLNNTGPCLQILVTNALSLVKKYKLRLLRWLKTVESRFEHFCVSENKVQIHQNQVCRSLQPLRWTHFAYPPPTPQKTWCFDFWCHLKTTVSFSFSCRNSWMEVFFNRCTTLWLMSF